MSFTFDPEHIDALVFDIGGVFVVPHHQVIAGVLRDAGIIAPEGPDAYHRAHYGAVRALSAAGGTDEGDPTFWGDYHHGYVRSLGLPDGALHDARRCLARLFGSEATVWSQLIPHNIAALARLATAGRPMAIVSNNDGTAIEQMADFGVCQVGRGALPEVRIIVDSGVIGVRKPDPAIFAPALEALGTGADRTLYVGDTVHADVRGARAAGMAVVQIDPYDDHDGFDHDRIVDLVALAELFGV